MGSFAWVDGLHVGSVRSGKELRRPHTFWLAREPLNCARIATRVPGRPRSQIFRCRCPGCSAWRSSPRRKIGVGRPPPALAGTLRFVGPRPVHRSLEHRPPGDHRGRPDSLIEPRRPLLAAWSRTHARQELADVEWNVVTKTPGGTRFHSPLYLDIVEDGVLLVDRGQFFETMLDAMRARMDGGWYWDVKQGLRVRRGGRDMTSSGMGGLCIKDGPSRVELVRLAAERRLSAAVVREAQECVGLFLRGTLRLVAVESTRTHDVAEMLRREAARFPEWFRTEIHHLATEMAGHCGVPFYGDERQHRAPATSSTSRTPNGRSATSNTSPVSATRSSTPCETDDVVRPPTSRCGRRARGGARCRAQSPLQMRVGAGVQQYLHRHMASSIRANSSMARSIPSASSAVQVPIR